LSKNREQLDGGVGAGRRKRVREGEGDAAPAEWEKQEGEEFQVSFLCLFLWFRERWSAGKGTWHRRSKRVKVRPLREGDEREVGFRV